MKKYEFVLSDEMVEILCDKFDVSEREVKRSFDDFFESMGIKGDLISICDELNMFGY